MAMVVREVGVFCLSNIAERELQHRHSCESVVVPERFDIWGNYAEIFRDEGEGSQGFPKRKE